MTPEQVREASDLLKLLDIIKKAREKVTYQRKNSDILELDWDGLGLDLPTPRQDVLDYINSRERKTVERLGQLGVVVAP